MLISVSEYLSAVWRHWFFLVVGLVGGALGFVDLVRGSEQTTERLPAGETVIHSHSLIPLWMWVTLMVAGFVCAQFLAWNDMRRERDTATAAIEVTRSARPRVKWDLAVGLLLETTPRAEIQLGLLIDNNGHEPIRWHGEYLKVAVEGRISQHVDAPDDPSSPGGVVGAGLSNKYRAPWVRGANGSKQILNGTVEYSVRYSHADAAEWEYRRRHAFQVVLYPPADGPGSVWDIKTGDLGAVQVVDIAADGVS